jgi:organic radical activating enzyme
LFLQPVTPLGEQEKFTQQIIQPPTPDKVLEWQSLMKRFVKQVRVVPQSHKMLNQM